MASFRRCFLVVHPAAHEFNGIDRWSTMYDFREFTAAGGDLGFASDVFSSQEAVRANPFFGIQAAMTRVDPMFSLEPGKLANFVVLNRDIFTTPAEEMFAVTAECTYFEGEKRCITSSLSVSRE